MVAERCRRLDAATIQPHTALHRWTRPDVNAGDGAVWPAVDMLLARGVPLVLAMGYDASAIPPAYADLPRCEKPTNGQGIVRALTQVLAPQSPDAD